MSRIYVKILKYQCVDNLNIYICKICKTIVKLTILNDLPFSKVNVSNKQQ